MRAIDAIVERRIRTARENGELEGLSGHGEPLPDLDQVRPEGWWARRLVATELPELARDPSILR